MKVASRLGILLLLVFVSVSSFSSSASSCDEPSLTFEVCLEMEEQPCSDQDCPEHDCTLHSCHATHCSLLPATIDLATSSLDGSSPLVYSFNIPEALSSSLKRPPIA